MSRAYRQHQITLVQRTCPHQPTVDLLRLDPGPLAQLLSNVLTVDIHGVQGRKAAGKLGRLCSRLEGQALDGNRKVSHG